MRFEETNDGYALSAYMQQISSANVGRSIDNAKKHIRSSRREMESKEEEYGVHSV